MSGWERLIFDEGQYLLKAILGAVTYMKFLDSIKIIWKIYTIVVIYICLITNPTVFSFNFPLV